MSSPLPMVAHEKAPEDDPWLERLVDAFADPRRKEFLPLAEEAERARPGHPVILCLAATAALFDQRPDRAQIYLKRHAKRYERTGAHHLLTAFVLARQGKKPAARALLKRHGLDDISTAFLSFAGGLPRLSWLIAELDALFGESDKPVRKTRQHPRPALVVSPRQAHQPEARAHREALVASSVASALPIINFDIPVQFEMDAVPLQALAAKAPEADGRWFDLRARFAHLSLVQGFDELLCVHHLKGVETLWHQTETVRKVLKQFRGRVLLADEVGLGKTIEAAMVLKEYMLRGLVARALILVPPSLVGQWRGELDCKFGIACLTTHDPMLRDDPEKFWSQPVIVASLALARRSEHARFLAERAFDIVIVDEAHHLRERTSQSYRLVDGLNKRFLLLLSATPVQNDLVELFNILTLLKPGVFKTLKEFRTVYVAHGNPRKPSNPERLRELLRTAMIRNTRAVVALKLPRRNAATLRIDAGENERTAYQALLEALRSVAAKAGERMAIRHLLGAAGSSPKAAETALLRFAACRADKELWIKLARQWAEVDGAGKATALVDLLRRNPQEKKLVFVHYRATLDCLAERLANEGFSFARFDGGMSGPEKDAAIAAFHCNADILLCTESGGEGRNIQFCNTLINFDVPWNPMAIEQRIGRLDRIGQTREVFVFNLATRGTIEEEILALLDEKIAMFELVVGEAGAILGSMEDDEGEFANRVLDCWLEASEAARASALDALGQSLVAARARHEGAKTLDDALFGEDFEAA